MGATKTDLFTERQNRTADLFRVLGHPARIAILDHLLSTRSCICGDLVEVIGLAQSTISQHLRELKDTGVIKGQVEGVKVCYCVDMERWAEVEQLLSHFFMQGKKETPCC